jgi:hypothetical protein
MPGFLASLRASALSRACAGNRLPTIQGSAIRLPVRSMNINKVSNDRFFDWDRPARRGDGGAGETGRPGVGPGAAGAGERARDRGREKGPGGTGEGAGGKGEGAWGQGAGAEEKKPAEGGRRSGTAEPKKGCPACSGKTGGAPVRGVSWSQGDDGDPANGGAPADDGGVTGVEGPGGAVLGVAGVVPPVTTSGGEHSGLCLALGAVGL